MQMMLFFCGLFIVHKQEAASRSPHGRAQRGRFLAQACRPDPILPAGLSLLLNSAASEPHGAPPRVACGAWAIT